MADDKKPHLRLVGSSNVVPIRSTDLSEKMIKRLLGYLGTHDPLFDHNVPEDRRDLRRGDLGDFLIRTYLPSRFEIVGETAVQKYLRVYDFVEYTGERAAFKYDFYIRPGMKGVITAVDLRDRVYPLTILWEQCPEVPDEQEFKHGGDKLVMTIQNGSFQRKIRNKIELLAAATPGGLVEPTEVACEYAYYLPVGAQGIVTKIDSTGELPIHVLFGNTYGYVPGKYGSFLCSYEKLKLFRENTIDIKAVLKKIS